MTMHRYPSYMVPYPGLNPDVKVNDLMSRGAFAIARRVDKAFSEEDIIMMPDGTGIVRMDSSLREDFFERVPNLSVTMLRQAFPIESAKYSLAMKPGSDDWNGGVVNPWCYKEKASIVSDCYLMVYPAENLHGQPVKYQRRFEHREDAKVVEDYYEDLKNEIVSNSFTTKRFYKAIGQIVLNHTPTMLNYWHFELKLGKSEGGFIESAKYKPNENQANMNMKPSFVDYVLENYMFKLFWVDKNPCKDDLPDDCFFVNNVSALKRGAAKVWSWCLFKMVPIVVEP